MHLPASYLTESDGLADPENDIVTCISKELDLRQLVVAQGWLFIVGQPSPPSPLHHQLVLDRQIFVTERMDMHLVWTRGRIHIKPIPRFLLDREVWIRTLSFNPAVFGSTGTADYQILARERERLELRKRALGFLSSYVGLIRHEIDYQIAKEKGLLPPEVAWASWKLFVRDLRRTQIGQDVDTRFIYGELRLSQLNLIAKFGSFAYVASFMISLSEFVSDNFAWLASVAVFLAIILTAMQVGLATKTLSNSDVFQTVSYRLATFTVLAFPLAASFLVFAHYYFYVVKWYNGLYKKRYQLFPQEDSAGMYDALQRRRYYLFC